MKRSFGRDVSAGIPAQNSLATTQASRLDSCRDVCVVDGHGNTSVTTAMSRQKFWVELDIRAVLTSGRFRQVSKQGQLLVRFAPGFGDFGEKSGANLTSKAGESDSAAWPQRSTGYSAVERSVLAVIEPKNQQIMAKRELETGMAL